MTPCARSVRLTSTAEVAPSRWYTAGSPRGAGSTCQPGPRTTPAASTPSSAIVVPVLILTVLVVLALLFYFKREWLETKLLGTITPRRLVDSIQNLVVGCVARRIKLQS